MGLYWYYAQDLDQIKSNIDSALINCLFNPNISQAILLHVVQTNDRKKNNTVHGNCITAVV